MPLSTRFISYTIFFVIFSITINGQILQDAKSLYTFLTNGYIKNVIPRANESEPLDVKMAFLLFSINYFKEVEEKVSITGGLSMTWTDPSLAWDPTQYGGKQMIEIPSSVIWTPPMYLVNTPYEIRTVGGDIDFACMVDSNGSVNYIPGDIMEATCVADTSKFPYDTQTCTLDFLPWAFYSWIIKISSISDSLFFPYFTENSNWGLVSHSAMTEIVGNGVYSYKVIISIKRQPSYFSVTIILPTILFCLLNPLVFLLPTESGERLSLAMTILLSYVIFLTLVTASIPATSNPLCALLVVMILIIVVSGLVVIFVIISMKYYHEEDYRVSKYDRVFIKLTCRRKIFPNEKCLSGRDFSIVLDKIFFVVSNVLLLTIIISFVIFVNT